MKYARPLSVKVIIYSLLFICIYFFYVVGLVIVKVIREFIVSDTNKALDQGWLEPLPVN